MELPHQQVILSNSKYSEKRQIKQKKSSTELAQTKSINRMSFIHNNMIQKFKKHTQQIKELKKTISAVSYSRLSQMKRLKPEHFLQPQSINLYKLSNPQLRSNTIKTITSNKILLTLNQKKPQNNQIFKQYHSKSPILGYFQQQKKQINEENLQNSQKQGKVRQTTFQQTYQQKGQSEVKINIQNQSQISKQSGSKRQIRSFSANIPSQKNDTIEGNQSHRSIKTSQNDLRISVLSKGSMNMKERFEQRLKQSRAKMLQSKVKLVESQTNFKLQKKIKENIELINKQSTLHELIHSRMQHQRLKTDLIRRKNEQKRFIHDCKRMKVNIARLSKRQYQKKEKQMQRSRSEETLLDLTYKRYTKEVQKLKKQQQLAYRLSFLKNIKSQDLVVPKIINPQQSLAMYEY